MAVDYDFKSTVMQCGFDILQRNVSKTFCACARGWTDAKLVYSLPEAIQINQEMMITMPREWKEASKINYARYKRTHRLRDRISDIMSSDCVFATLTFTDDILSSTSEQTRRTYVRRFCDSQSDLYVANVDYGGKNGREHYHAVIQVPCVDCTQWHKIGGIKVERIKVSEKSSEKLSKYLNKLTNHAIKETAQCKRIIYSR